MPLYQVPGAPAEGVIKSIQRGTANGSSSTWAINISSINPAKSLVILIGGLLSDSGSASGPRVTALTSTQIQGDGGAYYSYGNWNPAGFSWQVIEFY